LLIVIVVLLFTGVVARYVFSLPVVWIDEVVSLSFLWVAMLGTVMAMHRNEHLRLTLVVERLPARWRGLVQAFALVAVGATLLALLPQAMSTPRRVGHPHARARPAQCAGACRPSRWAWRPCCCCWWCICVAHGHVAPVAGGRGTVVAVGLACWAMKGTLRGMGYLSLLIFLVGVVTLCLAAGCPSASASGWRR
jgi:TRAP-type C4-dicarboxylate transport system permease small subunit